jgi:hypothetical protein
MKKPTPRGKILLQAIEDGTELRLFQNIRTGKVRYQLNSWPTNRATVEACIKRGWIEVQSGLFGDIYSVCTITVAGQEAIQ